MPFQEGLMRKSQLENQPRFDDTSADLLTTNSTDHERFQILLSFLPTTPRLRWKVFWPRNPMPVLQQAHVDPPHSRAHRPIRSGIRQDLGDLYALG